MTVVQIEKKVPTSQDISEILMDNGWNPLEVTSVWTVSTNKLPSETWNLETLEFLGGKGILSRIWDDLKSSHLTGYPKRAAETPSSINSKRQRLHKHSKTKVSKAVVPSDALSSMIELPGSQHSPSTKDSSFCSRNKPRRTLRAKRTCPDAHKKITWWFKQQKDEQELPTTPTTPLSPSPTTSPLSQTTSNRRKRGRKAKKNKLEEAADIPTTFRTKKASSRTQILPPDHSPAPQDSSQQHQDSLDAAPKLLDPAQVLPKKAPKSTSKLPTVVKVKTTG